MAQLLAVNMIQNMIFFYFCYWVKSAKKHHHPPVTISIVWRIGFFTVYFLYTVLNVHFVTIDCLMVMLLTICSVCKCCNIYFFIFQCCKRYFPMYLGYEVKRKLFCFSFVKYVALPTLVLDWLPSSLHV